MGDEECFGMGAYGRSGSGAGWIGWWLRWRDVEREREGMLGVSMAGVRCSKVCLEGEGVVRRAKG